MKKLVLVAGPAGIGKSTFARNYVHSHPQENCFVISADEVRKSMCGSYKDFPPNHDMHPVYDEMVRLGKKYIEENESLTLIIDTTMLYNRLRLFWIDSLPGFDIRELYLIKVHDYELCLKRNKLRDEEKWVPEEVIASMASHYEDPNDEVKSKVDHIVVVYND